MSITEVIAHGIKAVAAACLIGGGTMVLTNARDNAVQDSRLGEIEYAQKSTAETMRDLNESVQKLDKSVAVLNERLKRTEEQ